MKSSKEIFEIIINAQYTPLINGYGKINSANMGIRTTDIVYKVGDMVDCSFEWNDNVKTNHKLNGTCAVGFGTLWGDEDDVKAIQKALELSRVYDLCFDNDKIYKYLIVGTSSDYGEDEDEIIIQRAEVLACLS